MDATLLQAVVVIIISIVVLSVIAFGIRRFASSRSIAGNLPIRVIARQPLGNKAFLVIADIGNKRLLLGVTDHSVTLLATITPPPSPTQPATKPPMAGAPSQSNPAELSFRAYLSSIFQRTGK